MTDLRGASFEDETRKGRPSVSYEAEEKKTEQGFAPRKKSRSGKKKGTSSIEEKAGREKKKNGGGEKKSLCFP